MQKAAFLDRDGVINRKAPGNGYITTWKDMEILPGVPDSIAKLNNAGFQVIVVSNQRCVAKGLITIAGLESLHDRMREHLAQSKARIDAIYYCPHETSPPCRCRKPQPGMLLDAARDHNIDLAQSWMIGDSAVDVEAGRRAGCRTILLANGQRPPEREADLIGTSLAEVVERILKR
jgi:histidinol-phosphate phosphatase family domain/HAD-superfamily hydrolase, subfamily IIIA